VRQQSACGLRLTWSFLCVMRRERFSLKTEH
jgi:hypothetical protein